MILATVFSAKNVGVYGLKVNVLVKLSLINVKIIKKVALLAEKIFATTLKVTQKFV